MKNLMISLLVIFLLIPLCSNAFDNDDRIRQLEQRLGEESRPDHDDGSGASALGRFQRFRDRRLMEEAEAFKKEEARKLAIVKAEEAVVAKKQAKAKAKRDAATATAKKLSDAKAKEVKKLATIKAEEDRKLVMARAAKAKEVKKLATIKAEEDRKLVMARAAKAQKDIKNQEAAVYPILAIFTIISFMPRFAPLKNIFLWTFPFYLGWFMSEGDWHQEHMVGAAVGVWIILFIFSSAKVCQSVVNSDKSKAEEQSGVMKPLLWIVGLIICCFVPVLLLIPFIWMWMRAEKKNEVEYNRCYTYCSSCMGEISKSATRCPHCTSHTSRY